MESASAAFRPTSGRSRQLAQATVREPTHRGRAGAASTERRVLNFPTSAGSNVGFGTNGRRGQSASFLPAGNLTLSAWRLGISPYPEPLCRAVQHFADLGNIPEVFEPSQNHLDALRRSFAGHFGGKRHDPLCDFRRFLGFVGVGESHGKP